MGAKSVAKLDVSNLEKLTADKKAARRLDDRLPEISLLELAGQMSKIEVRIFSRILEKELFDLAWKKPGNRHMCRHILRLIDRSNNVSFWVATQILQDTGDNSAEKRSNRLKKFIKLAQVRLNPHSIVVVVVVAVVVLGCWCCVWQGCFHLVFYCFHPHSFVVNTISSFLFASTSSEMLNVEQFQHAHGDPWWH